MERWPGWKIEVEVECESSPALYGYENWHETEFYIAPEVADLARRGLGIFNRLLDSGIDTAEVAVLIKNYIAELGQISGK